MPFGDSFVATAKSTHLLTKWQMYINTYTFFAITLIKGLFYSFFVAPPGKLIKIPIRYGWVTGISGTGDIVFLDHTMHNCCIVSYKSKCYRSGKI